MDSRTHSDVTIIGLGLVGRALADALLRAGHSTTVWNRTADKADGLTTRGAVSAGTPAEAITASPLILTCVTDYSSLQQVLDPLGEEVNAELSRLFKTLVDREIDAGHADQGYTALIEQFTPARRSA